MPKFSIPNERKPLLYFSPKATARTTSATASAEGSVAPAYARRLVRAGGISLSHVVAIMIIALVVGLVFLCHANNTQIEVVR